MDEKRKVPKWLSLLKYAFYVALIAFLLKLALNVYFGYFSITVSYGGAFFYNWRKELCNSKLSKSTYVPNKLIDQPANKFFTYYLDMVQLKGESDKTHYPLHFFPVPETFVLDPKKTWTIFYSGSESNYDSDVKRFQIDVDWLNARNGIIVASCKYPTTPSKDFKPNYKYFLEIPIKELKSILDLNDFRGCRDDFFNIIKKIIGGEKDYYVELTNDSAKMTDKLRADLLPLVKKAFQGVEVSEDAVNGFFLRLAKIKVTAMDAHITNRILLHFAILFSNIKVGEADDKVYKEHLDAIKDLEGKVIKEPKNETFKHKLDREKKAMRARRFQLILDDASFLFAKILGNKGPYIKEDYRFFLEKMFGLKTPKEEPKLIFTDQINQLLALY